MKINNTLYRKISFGAIIAIGLILTIASLSVQMTALSAMPTLAAVQPFGYPVLILMVALVPDFAFVALSVYAYQLSVAGKDYWLVTAATWGFVGASIALNVLGSTNSLEMAVFFFFPVLIAILTNVAIGSVKVLAGGKSDEIRELENKVADVKAFVAAVQSIEIATDANTDNVIQQMAAMNEEQNERFANEVERLTGLVAEALKRPEPEPVDNSDLIEEIQELKMVVAKQGRGLAGLYPKMEADDLAAWGKANPLEANNVTLKNLAELTKRDTTFVKKHLNGVRKNEHN